MQDDDAFYMATGQLEKLRVRYSDTEIAKWASRVFGPPPEEQEMERIRQKMKDIPTQ